MTDKGKLILMNHTFRWLDSTSQAHNFNDLKVVGKKGTYLILDKK